METETTTLTIPANDLAKGDCVLYPVWVGNTMHHAPRTIGYVVEYPENRVIYFREGGYGIVCRGATLTRV